jgi:hypothetical protein
MAARQIETTASTGSLDRELDRILPTAWQLDHYRRSPVVLWQHSRDLPPIAKSLDVRVVGNALRTVDQFPERGIFPLADTIHDLVVARFITSKSVGFRPIAWRPNEEGGRNYTAVELLEHSFVNLPANPEAVITAKAQGVRDPAALTRFFGTPRGGEMQVIDDGADLVTVDPAVLADAWSTVIRQRARAAVRRAASGLLGVTDGEESVLLVDDGQPDDLSTFWVGIALIVQSLLSSRSCRPGTAAVGDRSPAAAGARATAGAASVSAVRWRYFSWGWN